MEWSEFSTGLREVCAAIGAGQFDDAERRYVAITGRTRRYPHTERSIRDLLDVVVAFADAREVERARHQFDRVMFRALESGVPIDHGDFSYAEGVIFAAGGDHVEAAQRFAAATEAFAEYRRDRSLAFAASRCAWVVDQAASPAVALRAHQLAASAFEHVTDGFDLDAFLRAQHLREVGRGTCVVNDWSVAATMDALDPYLEARDIFIALEQVEETAYLDGDIGQLYCTLGLFDAARYHWETARDGFVAVGNAASAQEMTFALARLEPPTTEFGRSAS